MRQGIKGFWLLLGVVCLVLGAAGAVLPVLPTTPFLLAASYCLAKGSDRFHRWFLSTGLYRRYLKDFAEKRAMTAKAKWTILLPASAMLCLALYFSPVWWARALIVCVLIGKYAYFFTQIKTIRA